MTDGEVAATNNADTPVRSLTDKSSFRSAARLTHPDMQRIENAANEIKYENIDALSFGHNTIE